MRDLIFNSDDFGISYETNKAIMLGYLNGVITSACVLANGDAYSSAIKEILPEIPDIGIGVHLNIIEGKSLTKPTMLCDSKGCFNNSFLEILSKSNDKNFLNQIEKEFRVQIEKILSDTSVDHINSHVHTHAIPSIFNLTAKLAVEYGIKNIRTQHERPYFIPRIKKHIDIRYPLNLVKLMLLNSFSAYNKKTVRKYNCFTNDYLIGVTYTGYMDEDSILYGLRALKNTNKLTEILIHPWYFENDIKKQSNYNEFLLTQSKDIKDEIKRLDFNLISYKQLNIKNEGYAIPV